MVFFARKVIEQDDQPNQTAGRKRKGDETDEPEKPPISAKRDRQEEFLLELAATVRERRERIKKIITDIDASSGQHSNSLDPANRLPGAIEKLSDPAAKYTLAFPFVGFDQSDRFKVVQGNWPYVGRTKFKELVQELREVRQSEVYSHVWLYGTQGYGKSHLLAALVCYLVAQDERVIYIPDCRTLLQNPVKYVRNAMLFAWADNITTQREIMKLDTKGEIEDFFDPPLNAIFVVDQMNALKTSDVSRDEARHRQELSQWLDRFILGHKAVYSSSANHTDYLQQSIKQNSNRVLRVYGGLTRTEMDEWWKRSGITMGEGEKEKVEDTTGCIPLLLDKCIVNGKIDLNVTKLTDIYECAAGFAQQIRDKTEGEALRWEWYCDFVTACFAHNPIPHAWQGNLDLIDHRYFYWYLRDSKRYGGYTCGLARNGVADQLSTIHLSLNL